ncbi:hypothetical protein E2320_003916 [Naja naja]|nr:hypothetical protein E2320_003916 [Naja naja]
MFEILPKEYLEIIEVTEKLRAKERRQRIHEDKLKELRRIQEERLKLALERAIAEPKKRVVAEVYSVCCGTQEVSSMTSFQMLKK